MQTRPKSQGDMRHGRGPTRPGDDWYLGPFDRRACVVTVREPEICYVSGKTEQRRPDHHARSHESRNVHTRYRQDLHFESARFGYPACGRKTRPRKSSYEIGVQQQKLATPTATV